MTLVIFLVCFYYNELYDLTVVRNRTELTLRLLEAVGAGCILLGIIYFVIPGIQIGRGVLFISLVLLSAAAVLSRMTLDFAWRTTTSNRRILVLGAGSLAVKVGREITRRDDLGLELVGFMDLGNGPRQAVDSLFGRLLLEPTEDLSRVIAEHEVSRIVVALEDGRGALPLRSLFNLRARGIPIEEAHTTLSALTGRVWLEFVRPSWFLYSTGFHRSRLTILIKRAADLAFGLAGLILTAPVMLLTAIVVRLDSRGPALYRQQRVGLGGKLFDVLKFRSMVVDAERNRGAQWAQENDPRVTRVGRFLRKYRLDELPQFINVIRGDMSFVGPRPERPFFVDQLKEKILYYDERHSVRPGITGWAQVQYPYGSTTEDAICKHEYDLFYLKNMSLLFDCAIIFQTVRIVLFGRGSR